MTRRAFLSLAVAAPALTFDAPPVRLGYDTYSLRSLPWRALEHLEYAAAQQLDMLHISVPRDCEPVSAARLALIRERAAQHGILLETGLGALLPQACASVPGGVRFLAEGIAWSAALGANVMRTFVSLDRERLPAGAVDRHIETAVAILRGVRSQAMDAGVRIAVENHKDLLARELREIFEQAGPDFVGLCLDTGNAPYLAEDPLDILELLAPNVLTTHIRDAVIYPHRRGAAVQWVPVGEGTLDLRRFAARFRELCKNGRFCLENITGRPAQIVPYLEENFWQDKRRASAAEFAAFLRLAGRGQPYEGRMVMFDAEGYGAPPQPYAEALRHQQREHLERGLEYSRKALGVGLGRPG